MNIIILIQLTSGGMVNMGLPKICFRLSIIAVSAILASCGGGDNSTETATEQAQAAVPGAWTGRAPKVEVINGITVPPEPSLAANNATLAGVDANANGVRDDVDRKLAKAQLTPAEYSASIIVASEYQRIIVSALSGEALNDSMKKIACAAKSTSRNTDIRTIQFMVINSDNRLKLYRKILSNFGGMAIDPDSDCI
jgi:hypothetical protein